MSVDPDRPADSDPALPKIPPDAAPDNADAARLKRRFKKGGVESEDDEKPDQTIQLLSSLLQELIAKKDQSGAAETDAKTAKIHRLSKKGAPATATLPETAATSSGDPVLAAPTGTPLGEATGASTASPQPPPVTFRTAPIRESASTLRWVWMAFFGFLACAGLTFGMLAYFQSTPRGSVTATKAPAATIWDDAMLRQLDQALAADQAGDLRGAQRLASAIKRPGTPPPPGLEIYLASLTTRQEHTYDVEADLLRAVGSAPPEAAAAMNERLAFNFSRARDFQKASDFFRAASLSDPFSPALFYHWGEALRHLGHFQEAAEVYQRALARVPTGQPETESLRECINLKQRLALVEQSRDSEIQAELDTQLKAPQPSGYWLLTAAAIALQHKNLPEAAGFFARAREALGVGSFNELLNDYYFRAYADRKELAEFFPPDRAARLQPTMTYTVEP